MNYTITLTGTPLSPTFNGTLEQLHQAILAGITATISSSNIITGKIGGTMPPSDIGPWLNGTTWYVYSGGTYVPATVAIGNGAFKTTLTGSPTAARTITLQDKGGTLALLSDVYEPRTTSYPAMQTAPAETDIDWSVTNSFGFPLDRDISLRNINSMPGQEVHIAIYNGPALVHTVTWPPDVKWAGAAPTQSTNDKTDIYVLRNLGGQIFGQALQGYA